jgi:hypothetical protein
VKRRQKARQVAAKKAEKAATAPPKVVKEKAEDMADLTPNVCCNDLVRSIINGTDIGVAIFRNSQSSD